MNINVIGAGTWGIVFASYLSNLGYNIKVYHRNSSTSKDLIKNYKHPKLDNYKISNTIRFSSNLNKLNPKYITVIAVSSDGIYEVLKSLDCKNIKYVVLSKGFNLDSRLLPSEILSKKFNININNISILSGPNHAEEIIDNKPTASILASKDLTYCKYLQEIFSSDKLRLYTTTDIIGVQVGAAVKNVIAIAIGVCDGLGLGDNAKASIVSRGMNEIIELKKIYKLSIKTLYGLSGLGDLVGTCYSKHSRNRKLGNLLSKSKTLEESQDIIGMISEGIHTSKVLNSIIAKNKLNMPICNEVYNILFHNTDPSESINKLMLRKLKREN
tara:strand:+ start:1329 stop:2309 length:981 start_codon:yes stop_codon:yes gene_type:complete